MISWIDEQKNEIIKSLKSINIYSKTKLVIQFNNSLLNISNLKDILLNSILLQFFIYAKSFVSNVMCFIFLDRIL